MNSLSKYDMFATSGLIDARIGVAHDIKFSSNESEHVKNITGGGQTTVRKKFQDNTNLDRIPMIFTSNHDLFNLADEAWRQRIESYSTRHIPELKKLKKLATC